MSQVSDLGQVIDHDVHILRMLLGVVLVIIFRGIKRVERNYLRGDRL